MRSNRSAHMVMVKGLSGLCLLLLCLSGCRSTSEGSGSQPDGGNSTHSVFSADLAGRLRQHGAKTGDIQASLLWNNFNDLDIHIVEPSGERIYFAHKRSRTGGELDVDMNAGGPKSDEPVENIYFPKNRAPAGKYKVYVDHYANHGSQDPTAFRCEVLVNGRVKKFSGEISDGEKIRLIYEFTLKGSSTRRTPAKPVFKLFTPIRRADLT